MSAELRAELHALHPDMLFCDGLDEALIGTVERCSQEVVALYDINRIIKVLLDEGDFDDAEDVIEHVEFNVIGAWVGPHTPAFARLWR